MYLKTSSSFLINNIYRKNNGNVNNFIGMYSPSYPSPNNCRDAPSQCYQYLSDASLECSNRSEPNFGTTCSVSDSPWIDAVEAHTKDACQINMGNRHKLVDLETYGSFLIRIYGKMFADFVSGDLSKPTVTLGPHFSCKVLNYNATYIVCQTESSGVGKDLSIIVQNTKTGRTNYDTISKLGMYYCVNVNADNCRETISFKAPRLHGLSAVQGDTRGNFALTLSEKISVHQYLRF